MSDTQEVYDPEIEKDIFDTRLDNEQAKSEEKKLLLGEGWYTTEPPVTFTPKVTEQGRRVGRFFATVHPNKGGDPGKIGFGVSPDVRYKEGEEKADFGYRMFLAARKAYVAATGAEPEKESDVMRYLTEYPTQVRVIQTEDNENLVVSIRAVRE